MARLTNEERIVRQIIKTHGPVIDLKANPELFIEIVRKHDADLAVGTRSGLTLASIDDVMKEVFKLQRQVAKLAERIGPQVGQGPGAEGGRRRRARATPARASRGRVRCSFMGSLLRCSCGS